MIVNATTPMANRPAQGGDCHRAWRPEERAIERTIGMLQSARNAIGPGPSLSAALELTGQMGRLFGGDLAAPHSCRLLSGGFPSQSPAPVVLELSATY
jgi:hypothetical protein